ncbi:TetR family transcriptional regulator [Pseudomonas sp. R3-41]
MVRRTKVEALETRNRILEAAATLFHTRGVARTTLADIAALAGVTRGAIYWHFSSKADLVISVLDNLNATVGELSRQREDEEDPLNVMSRLLLTLFQQMVTCPRKRRVYQIAFYNCELTNEFGSYRDNRKALLLSGRICIARIFVSAVKKGLLPADLDTDRAAIFHYAFVEGVIRHWLLMPEIFDIYQEAKRLTDISFEVVASASSLRNRIEEGD